MQEWIIQFGAHHQYLIYVAILLIAIVEGPVLSMIFGALLSLGYFSLIPIYLTLMLGDVISDVTLYHIGRKYGHSVVRRFGKYFNVTEKEIAKAEKLFHENTYKILFVSKITNGFGLSFAVLTTAGIVRIPFRKYLLTNIAGQMIWSGALLAVGYFFSQSYIHINNIFGRVFLIALALAMLYWLYRYIVRIRSTIIDQ